MSGPLGMLKEVRQLWTCRVLQSMPAGFGMLEQVQQLLIRFRLGTRRSWVSRILSLFSRITEETLKSVNLNWSLSSCDPDGFHSSLEMHDTCSIYNLTVLLSLSPKLLRSSRKWKPYDPDRLPSETITERITLESDKMWLGIPAGFQTVF
ncbi:hypothetical protein Pst134EA_021299 [Puccinia striiformis f. sp. tritici]|uniref:hypothetical protein n=1 Tax=Puccinia striiformis f. sp. tritici TaxID=168172 RepID=UPI00200806E0|nr:hypothetical protein Pst134EA_021299 [Puccinia striiformis f. sp. tritici]KAH9457423.1 hypothetical protein Pst134EA_021299 [Puccinia striiformis f. sp. tritici]